MEEKKCFAVDVQTECSTYSVEALRPPNGAVEIWMAKISKDEPMVCLENMPSETELKDLGAACAFAYERGINKGKSVERDLMHNQIRRIFGIPKG